MYLCNIIYMHVIYNINSHVDKCCEGNINGCKGLELVWLRVEENLSEEVASKQRPE